MENLDDPMPQKKKIKEKEIILKNEKYWDNTVIKKKIFLNIFKN